MAIDMSKYLVVGISSRALFDLEVENQIYDAHGLQAYEDHQLKMENEILKPGVGFSIAKAILKLNKWLPGDRKAEVVIMSRNSAETSLRIFNSIEEYGLDITRAALTGGESLAPYLQAYSVDLFLSLHEEDVQASVNAGVASAMLYQQPEHHSSMSIDKEIDQIRIAFDGDAVLFSDESERIYQEQGLAAFEQHEKQNANNPIPAGPFAKLLKTLSYIQSESEAQPSPIRTALVTARASPAHERVIKTLRAWGVGLDETFFLGGMQKGEVLKAFGPNIFFDDQITHCDSASAHGVAAGKVPYRVK